MNSLAQSFSNYNQRLAPAPLDAENVFLGVMVRQAHQPCLALPDSTSRWHPRNTVGALAQHNHKIVN